MANAHVETQSANWFSEGGITQRQITITLASGNLAILALGWGNNATISSVADNQSNTWTHIRTQTDGTDGTIALYYAKNVNAGSTTITVTFSGDHSFGSIHVHEVSGADTSAPLDQSAAQAQFNATGTDAISSGDVTTTTNGQYIFGFTFDRAGVGGTVTAGTNGFTGLVDAGDGQSERQVQSSAGTIAAKFTTSAGFTAQITGIATFKEAGGAGGPVTKLNIGRLRPNAFSPGLAR